MFANRVKTIYELTTVMTKDLVSLAEGQTRAVTTDEFILEIRQRLEKLLAC